jgi:hypothetical protein
MRNKSVKEKLSEIFPTVESLNTARLKHTSWAEMSRAIGINKQSLYDYREYLGMTGANNGVKQKNFCFDTVRTTNELIRELIQGESKNIVKKYKITDPVKFFTNPCGNDGLEFIGTEQGTTWSQVSGQMPHAVSR